MKNWRHVGLVAILLLACMCVASATELYDHQKLSDCGATVGSNIVFVDDLNPRAPKGLLSALSAKGPKIILFRVGGVIPLDDDVEVKTPFITIAGESAPDPGIVLLGGTLKVRTHDVCISHITVRTGPSLDPTKAESRDGISIGGNPAKYGPIEKVLLQNVSVEWGIDENVGIFHPGTRGIQIRSTLMANALSQAGHPKGEHSKGMLVGSGVFDVAIIDSLFANNNDRNPRISPDTQVSLIRSAVVNPGFSSTEVFLKCTAPQPTFYLWNNILVPGHDTRGGLPQYRFVDDITRKPIEPGSSCAGFSSVRRSDLQGDAVSRQLETILTSVGSRPARRDPYAADTINRAINGTGRIISTPPTVQDVAPVSQKMSFEMPTKPFSRSSRGRMNIEEALCRAHLALGGLGSPQCQVE